MQNARFRIHFLNKREKIAELNEYFPFLSKKGIKDPIQSFFVKSVSKPIGFTFLFSSAILLP